MVREGNMVSFTEEERSSLKVKQYTEAELKENIKHFEQAENKRRYIMLLFLGAFVSLGILFRDLFYLFLLCAIFMAFLLIFYEYVAKINEKAVKRNFYVEIIVCEKLKVEVIVEPNLKLGSVLSFYPVKGRDPSTGYVGKFYLDTKAQYDAAQKGRYSTVKR